MNQAETIVGLGARSDYVAPVPQIDPQRLRLTAEEAQVLSSVGRASTIQELIQRSGWAEAKAIAVLLALRAKGAIVPARVNRPSGPVPPLDASMAEEVDLEDAKKAEILEIDGRLNGDHFRVLGVEPGTGREEIKKAYYDLSRKFHPDRFYKKNLGSFRARVERIFKRVSEAERILTDDVTRAEYLKEHPELNRRTARPAAEPAPRPRTAEDEERDAERRQWLSRHPYLARTSKLNELITRAKAHMAKGEYGLAYSDLNIAGQVDPKNTEVQALTAQVREEQNKTRAQTEFKRGEEAETGGDLAAAAAAYRLAASVDAANARAAFKAAQMMVRTGSDVREARSFAQRAADLEPKNADHHALYGTILLEMGMKKMAQKHLDLALELNPNHPEAKKHIKKGRWLF